MRKINTSKSRKILASRGWYEKLLAAPNGYRLKEMDFDAIANSMTTAQVQLLLSMVCAASALSSEEQRKYWAPRYHTMREAAERATGNKDISLEGLRLVASN